MVQVRRTPLPVGPIEGDPAARLFGPRNQPSRNLELAEGFSPEGDVSPVLPQGYALAHISRSAWCSLAHPAHMAQYAVTDS